MAPGIWFWIIYVIVGIFGGWWGINSCPDRRYFGGGLVIFILIGILGWAQFGPPISGGGRSRAPSRAPVISAIRPMGGAAPFWAHRSSRQSSV